jgi:flagellar motor switch protein FliM
MKKVLSQKEIDEMVRHARSPAEIPAAAPATSSVTLWDGRLAGQIGREHMQAISRLHESFAHNLSHSLGAYLRIQFDAALVSGEHLTYGQFLQGIPEVTYLASCKLIPAGISILLQLDLAVAFPLIDVLLGGEGKGELPLRGITEIEEQILESVMHIICRELQGAWQALSLEFQFDCRQHMGQVEQLIAAPEKVLLLSFEITVLERRGTLNLVVPAQVSNALLRKISDRSSAKPLPRLESERRLRARLLTCPFAVELIMPALKVPLRALAELAPGDVLRLGRSTQHPATLVVAGQEMFVAHVARHGPVRAARILARAGARDGASRRDS